MEMRDMQREATQVVLHLVVQELAAVRREIRGISESDNLRGLAKALLLTPPEAEELRRLLKEY